MPSILCFYELSWCLLYSSYSNNVVGNGQQCSSSGHDSPHSFNNDFFLFGDKKKQIANVYKILLFGCYSMNNRLNYNKGEMESLIYIFFFLLSDSAKHYN